MGAGGRDLCPLRPGHWGGAVPARAQCDGGNGSLLLTTERALREGEAYYSPLSTNDLPPQ